MYKIAICDDDKRYRKTIREIIEHKNSLPENEIRFYEYESGNELLKHTDILHELVFIDIRMPGLDGNQTALKLRNYNKDAVLIFCSSYFEPTVDSINFGQPFRYIMKDLHDTSLRREIAAIMTEVKRRFLNDYAVTVTSAGKIIRIYVENILYVSRAKRGCEITIVKEQEKETVRCREAFGELYEQLKDQGFAQAHYSYIVNLGKVEGLEKGVLRLKCGIELNVSRAKKEEFTEALFEYLRERNVDLMSLLSDALIGSFQMLMLNDFGKNMFPYRIKTCWKRILIYGVTALVILGVNHIESTFVNIMMVPVCYTIASIVIFQGSVWKKIILACCYYMLAIVPEFLFAVITGAYGVTGTENNFHSELEKLLSLLLMSTITFLLVKCFNQITRKKNYQTIENKLFTVLLTLPAATIIIFMCIYYSQISFTGVNRIMIPIGAALLLMTNICIFAVFDKLIEKSEEVKKMELLYQKSKAENINQKYINKVNEDKRVFLHDVNKFLCTAASLIENGKNLELDSMVRHLGIRMEELKNYSYCADPVLNSILCERKFVAESKGILYKIKLGNNLRTDFIEDLDLISIVGNLLYNAIEAAEKTKKDQHVICNMYMGNEGHLLVMEFYNSYILPLIKEREHYISTKRNPEDHGIGLHTVGKLVEKYGGVMRIEAGEEEFSVKIVFTVK